MISYNFCGGSAFRIAVGIIVLGLLIVGNAGAATFIVCPSGCTYSSIQAAINAASNGDTVQVQSGTYYENANVNKRLTLRSIGLPVVDARGSGSAITLSANGITLEGFTVTGGGSNPNAGINVISTSNTLSRNNVRSNSGYGISLDYSNNNTLISNNVSSNNNGISMYTSINNTLRGNNISNNVYDGIFLSYYSCNNTLISNNVNSNNRDGILLEGNSNNNTLSGNNAILNNRYGISVFTSINNTLSGNNVSNYQNGIYLWSSNNNTLSSNNASNNMYYGIYLDSSSNNTLSGNNASKNSGGISLQSNSNNNNLTGNSAFNNEEGIVVISSNNSTLSGNKASNNGIAGIYLDSSSNSTFINNIMTGNKYNFRLLGYYYSDFNNQIDTNNLVDGKPIYYIKGASNRVYDSSTNAGTFYCINCINVIIKNVNLNKNVYGIFFWNTSRSKIQNVNATNNGQGIVLFSSSDNILSGNNASNNIYGIYLDNSNNNMLSGNNASNNDDAAGISMDSSSNNTVTGNNASNNGAHGINLYSSSNNTVTGNNASNNYDPGISMGDSDNNTLSGNNVSNNDIGISLDYSNNNVLIGNNASNNGNEYSYYGTGISLSSSSNNLIYQNNLINNINYNAYDEGSNKWDNGTIGNHYSNFDEPGEGCIDNNNNGICDSSYSILGGSSADRYPLMKPYTGETPTPTDTPTPTPIINDPPNLPSALNQFKADGITAIALGNKTSERIVTFKAIISDSDNDQVKLQIELRRNDEFKNEFDENQPGLKESNLVSSGSDVAIIVDGLIDANYHWRARVVDEHGQVGQWKEFGDNPTADTDFIVSEYKHWVALVPLKLGKDVTSSVPDIDKAIETRAKDVETFYDQQSYHQEKIKVVPIFTWSDNSEITLDKTFENYEAEFGNDYKARDHIPSDAFSKIDSAKLIPYDAVVFVTATSKDFTPAGCHSNSKYKAEYGDCGSKSWAIFPDNRMSSLYIHEIGHALFDFTDKYNNSIGGTIGYWGIMGDASISGDGYIGADPLSPLDPISKRDAGWINEVPLDTGKNNINLINDKGVYFFDPGKGNYKFVIEGRNPPDNVLSDSWCASEATPCDKKWIISNHIAQDPKKGILLYRYHKDVDMIASQTKQHYSVDQLYSIPNQGWLISGETAKNRATLVPGGQYESAYTDHEASAEFHVTEEGGQLNLDIAKLNIKDEKVFVTDPKIIYILLPLGYTSAQNIPDIDLKVYNSAGQMVGMNYTSGMYERGIDGVNTSGDNRWIAYPDSMELYAVLDTTPLKKWAEEVNVTLPENITVPMHMIEYDSNGIRTETKPVNITASTEIPTVVEPSILLPETRYINGTVIDSINKTAISGATVSTNNNLSNTTNATGFYSFAVTEGEYNLTAKFEPTYYANNTITVSTIGSDVEQDIELLKKPMGTITGKVTGTPEAITVVSPNGGQDWKQGTSQTISWTSTGNPGNVNIELLKSGVSSTIISNTANDGSHSWTIPSSQTLGNDYKIRITSAINSLITDTSDNNFIISETPKSITIASPNGGENWRHGTTHTITWSTAGSPGSNVKIELLKSGTSVKAISSSTANDGSYSWAISSTQTVANDYKIRITSTSNSSYKDTSDNNFIIST